uniref:Uncharacterized protein n=1 Tax=Magallana gigas TaxID=29159 RepID=A0A8W8NQC9_MAGGI
MSSSSIQFSFQNVLICIANRINSGRSLSFTILNGFIAPMGVTKIYIALSVLFCQGVTYENVGFKKSAWEQNPYKYSQWGAERAVDGRNIQIQI